MALYESLQKIEKQYCVNIKMLNELYYIGKWVLFSSHYISKHMFWSFRCDHNNNDVIMNVDYRDKTKIYFQYIYHIAFWILENPTTLLALNKWQIQIDWH